MEKILPNPKDPEQPLTETFSYDANGNLVGCENPSIRIERKFDPEGKLLEERQGNQFVVKYGYDRTGNRISRTTEVKTENTTKTQTVKYGYDALGLAASVELPGHEPIKLTRNALGQVTEEQLSPNLKRTFDYSWEGYLTHQRVFNHEGSLFRQEYKYDRTGNLVQKFDSVLGTEQFNYDPIGRITGQTDPERKYKAYLYDPAGDLLKTQVQSEDEVWSRAGEYEGAQYRFDRVGNLVKRAGNQDKTEFIWDANGRLIESVSDGKITSYQYDPLGRRISKETDGVKTCFYWDGDALLGDVTGDDTREWVYYPGSFEPLAMVRNEECYLYHNEPNGCPSRLLDESGKVVWAARYDAWGKVKKLVENEVEQPLRLQGQYFDGETRLHYNRFRYYCSEIGSFVSQDPLGIEAGENIYAFGFNIQGWVDPLGLMGNPATATHIHYVGIDKATGKPYSGYASMQGKQTDFDVLKYRYGNDFDRFQTRPDVVYRGYGLDGKATARGLEQRDFEKFGGLDGTANKQNPVVKNNPNRTKYLNAADDHMKNNAKPPIKKGC